MNNAKIIKALNMIIEALNEDVVESPVTVEAEEKAEPKKAPKTVGKKAPKKETEAPVEEAEEETETPSEEKSVEDFKNMGYNDLKKYAQSLGIKAVGTRDQIMKKVEEALKNGGAEEEEAPVEKEDSKVVPISKGKKAGIKKKPVEEPAEEEEAEPEMDEIETKVREEAEDMDVTEIAEILQSVGVKASGKKEKLIMLLVQAVRDGKLDLDGDEESGEEEPAPEDNEDEEVDYTQYHEEYDPSGLNDPEKMTKKRAKAVSKMIEREVEAISSGETTEKDIKDFLNTLLSEEDAEELEINSMEEDELLFLYFEIMKAMIDDDGEEHEPSDPYTIGDENVCCGHALVYDEETEKYICQSCGETYEAE